MYSGHSFFVHNATISSLKDISASISANMPISINIKSIQELKRDDLGVYVYYISIRKHLSCQYFDSIVLRKFFLGI